MFSGELIEIVIFLVIWNIESVIDEKNPNLYFSTFGMDQTVL